jgi:hypothetical protein
MCLRLAVRYPGILQQPYYSETIYKVNLSLGDVLTVRGVIAQKLL